ncbi:MAG: hypothetical protein WC979_01190 [Candidatus Pacearchaeota archaeon]|jgi:preprotein translocase subunit YajC|nr:hypothetical protein [Clostridia bacterium]
MLNLKDRIALLKKRTSSTEAIELSNAALEACKSNGFMDSVIAETLVKDLANIDDKEVATFIMRENRIIEISNLGVRESHNRLMNSDLMHYPTIKPLIESMAQTIKSLPEYVTAQRYVDSLKQYSWNLELKADIAKISESIEKYKEDIQLANFMYEFKNSSGSYLSKMFEQELDTYFVERTAETRKAVIEKINPYLFDASMKHLHGILILSEGGLQIEANGQVSIEKIYSPVLINEKSEIFFASGRFLVKENDKIKSLTEAEIKTLPQDFVSIAFFLSQPNVRVFENKISVSTPSGNKNVDIIIEGENTKIVLNGKELPYQTFTKYFMNEGIFRQNENEILKQIAVLYENIGNVYEIDYGKRLVSKTMKGQWADVYKTEKSICLIKVNESQKSNEFITNVNGIQTKQLILEHLRFDISESLKDLIPAETEKLKNLEVEKGELMEAIQLLSDKKASVIAQTQSNPILRENAEVKELLSAIDTEINSLKEHENAVHNKINSLTKVNTLFNDEDFEQADDVATFWTNESNKNATIYFAQEGDNKKFFIGKQTLSDYKSNDYTIVEENLDAASAITKAKSLGEYFETDDAKAFEANDPDGVNKLDKKNTAMTVSDDIKKGEDITNPLESGDQVKLKNGMIGIVQGNDTNNNTIVAMNDGKSVSIPQQFLHEVEILKKKSNENNPEIKLTGQDGSQSVQIQENNEEGFVKGQMLSSKGEELEGDLGDILVKAIDYTSKGDNDKIEIRVGEGLKHKSYTLKKFIKIAE